MKPSLMPLELVPHRDDRGSVTEVYRASWLKGLPPVAQVVDSKSGPHVMRAMHSHKVQYDLWHFAAGVAYVQTYDPTTGELRQSWYNAGTTLVIPPGVAHGFYTDTGCTLIYLLTREWDGSDEFEFNSLDPDYPGAALWPAAEYVRSGRDRNARSFKDWLDMVTR